MRSFRDGVFVSEELPALRMRVVHELRYLGSFEFDLQRVAHVERHVFVEAEGGKIRRMLVLHFEHFLPAVDDRYRYTLSDPRELGGATYGRWVSALRVSEERAASPEAEMAHTERFVRSQGLLLPERHAVARYARIVGDDRRNELLIFFHECDGALLGILERAERAFDLAVQSSR